jgi:hypothetical protein
MGQCQGVTCAAAIRWYFPNLMITNNASLMAYNSLDDRFVPHPYMTISQLQGNGKIWSQLKPGPSSSFCPVTFNYGFLDKNQKTEGSALEGAPRGGYFGSKYSTFTFRVAVARSLLFRLQNYILGLNIFEKAHVAVEIA